MKFSFFLTLSLSFLLMPDVHAAPWTNETERGLAPWLRDGRNSERRAQRESFFAGLLAFDRSPSEEGEGIQDLPWKSYESEWSRPLQTPLLWPVENGRITSGYGPRRGSFHEGLDIAGPAGRPILAVNEGRVVFSGTLRGYGNTVVVYHGQGLASVYAHNRENLVRESQIVRRGQAIATIGSSGSATGPHLHFELRREGKPLNPLIYEFDRPGLNQAGL